MKNVQEEKRCCKRRTIMIATLFLIADLLLFLFHLYMYATCISIGMILSAGLQYPALLKSNKKNQKQQKMLFDVKWVEIVTDTMIIKIVIDITI